MAEVDKPEIGCACFKYAQPIFFSILAHKIGLVSLLVELCRAKLRIICRNAKPLPQKRCSHVFYYV
jgi:hypothetical protein